MSILIFVTIIVANFLSRFCALALAFGVSVWVLVRYGHVVAQLACGMLLAISLGHLVPEALEVVDSLGLAFAVFLGAILGFLLLDLVLEKTLGHVHTQGKLRPVPALLGGGFEFHADLCETHQAKALPILIGSSCHNFVDGVLVAAAFMTSLTAGIAITVAIFAHEVPQLIGQIAILRRFNLSVKATVLSLSFVALFAILGGIFGAVLFGLSQAFIPYAMLISAAAFLFVAFVLVKEDFFQKNLTIKAFATSLFYVALGAVLSIGILSIGHV